MSDTHRDGAARGTGIDRPGVFPPGPSRDHPAVPLGRRWQLAGAIIGITIAALAISIALAEREPGPDYRTFEPVELTIDRTGDAPMIDRLRIQVDPRGPSAGRVRVDGDDLVRVEIAGGALCAPVTGAPGAWIEVGWCGSIDRLVVTGHDIDDETVTAVARF